MPNLGPQKISEKIEKSSIIWRNLIILPLFPKLRYTVFNVAANHAAAIDHERGGDGE